MARLELLQPYDNKPPGAHIEMPGGVASVLVMRKIAKELSPPEVKANLKTKRK